MFGLWFYVVCLCRKGTWPLNPKRTKLTCYVRFGTLLENAGQCFTVHECERKWDYRTHLFYHKILCLLHHFWAILCYIRLVFRKEDFCMTNMVDQLICLFDAWWHTIPFDTWYIYPCTCVLYEGARGLRCRCGWRGNPLRRSHAEITRENISKVGRAAMFLTAILALAVATVHVVQWIL